jgi:dTMP kinase
VDAGLARARRANDGGKAPDAIGEETLAFHHRVREGYLALAAAHPVRVHVIDASQPLAAVAKAAWAASSHTPTT